MGLAFLITGRDLQVLSERKVLKRDEYAALLDGEGVLRAAQAEAQRIVRDAVVQAEDACRQGYQKGLSLARAEYAQRVLEGAADAQRQLRALRATMANIVVKAVRQIVATVEPRDFMESALRRVDELTAAEQLGTVRVHPSQAAPMREALMRLRGDPRWKINLSLVADESAQPGSCTVQTASGTLELGLEEQLLAVRMLIERERGQRRV